MLPPPSPLSIPPEPPPPRGSEWLRTIAAALALPAVGFALTWGTQSVLPLLLRLTHLPPTAIPFLGHPYVSTTLTFGVAFGLVPGALIALIDRQRPYAAAAIVPAAIASLGVAFTVPDVAAAAVAVAAPAAVWLCAATGIALVRRVRRA